MTKRNKPLPKVYKSKVNVNKPVKSGKWEDWLIKELDFDDPSYAFSNEKETIHKAFAYYRQSILKRLEGLNKHIPEMVNSDEKTLVEISYDRGWNAAISKAQESINQTKGE